MTQGMPLLYYDTTLSKEVLCTQAWQRAGKTYHRYSILSSMGETAIPVIVIDDTPIKRRGVCDFVEETPQLRLQGQAGDAASALRLIESICEEQRAQNPTLAGWLVLSDLRLGRENGVELGRTLLELAPGLRVVIYHQSPTWRLAPEYLPRA